MIEHQTAEAGGEPKTEQPRKPDNEAAKKEQPPSKPPEPKKGARDGRHRVMLIAGVALGLAAGAYLIWRLFFAQPKLPESIVALSGRIEGDDSAVAPKTSGRILEIRFREGDSVNAGDIVALLSDEQIRAREEQARAAVSVAE